ncbi:MAG: hypothetical protein K0R88_2257 [Solirubrobacterales bacterium]|nr:hypothetical protein [Solirubrobacterales bacterium]
MRKAAAIALALVAIAVVGCGEREEPEVTMAEPEFEITGEWRGRLTQKNLEPFTVTATIVSLERSKQNVVRYGGIECAGTWEYLGATETAYRFREVIDRGEGKKCKGTGTVALTPLTDDRVEYVFRGGKISSRGVLGRQG